jgi:hypothetical protein
MSSKITTKDGTEIYYKDWGIVQSIVFSYGFITSASASGLALIWATFSSSTFARPPSTFQSGCRNVKLKSNVLSAICRSSDGRSERFSILLLKGIENQDERLIDTGKNIDASFQNSCLTTSVNGDLLIATSFRTNPKESILSTLNIQGICNDDGRLAYES